VTNNLEESDLLTGATVPSLPSSSFASLVRWLLLSLVVIGLLGSLLHSVSGSAMFQINFLRLLQELPFGFLFLFAYGAGGADLIEAIHSTAGESPRTRLVRRDGQLLGGPCEASQRGHSSRGDLNCQHLSRAVSVGGGGGRGETRK
jgi:hypothetical protein